MLAIPLSWWLTVSAALFCIGVYGALSRRNAIGILMGIELMLNAVNVNLIAFWRYITPQQLTGPFALVGAQRGGVLALRARRVRRERPGCSRA